MTVEPSRCGVPFFALRIVKSRPSLRSATPKVTFDGKQDRALEGDVHGERVGQAVVDRGQRAGLRPHAVRDRRRETERLRATDCACGSGCGHPRRSRSDDRGRPGASRSRSSASSSKSAVSAESRLHRVVALAAAQVGALRGRDELVAHARLGDRRRTGGPSRAGAGRGPTRSVRALRRRRPCAAA